jgi:DNA repair photolyase
MMPILPGLCDDDDNLENVVRWTAEHGGQFVIASGLTLSDQQRAYFFDVLRERFPDLQALYQRYYPPKSYSASGWRWQEVALKIKEYCQKYGIRDRMPRPIIPGEKRALNKEIAARLADRVYDLEIERAPSQRVWAYRKAAWAVEDLEQDIRLVYRQMGLKGLESIPEVGPRLARQIESYIPED